MVAVAISLVGTASSWFISLSETDTQDRPTLSPKFEKQTERATTKFEDEAEAQFIQAKTFESLSFNACRLEDLFKKRWLRFDTKFETVNQWRTLINISQLN